MNTTVCEAIATKMVIEFWYEDGVRVVEPYCHGVTRPGNEVLRAYLVRGATASGNPNPWRLYSVAKMADMRVLAESFRDYPLDTGDRPV